jgi:hypothetical protein
LTFHLDITSFASKIQLSFSLGHFWELISSPYTVSPSSSSFQIRCIRWVLVAHTCNPSYSGGKDQEILNSRPVGDLIWKIPNIEKD